MVAMVRGPVRSSLTILPEALTSMIRRPGVVRDQ